MSEQLKNDLESVIKRQLTCISQSTEMLKEQNIFISPEITSAIENSSSKLKEALNIILEAIDRDTAPNKYLEKRSHIPAKKQPNSKDTIAAHSYSVPNKMIRKETPSNSIEETIRQKDAPLQEKNTNSEIPPGEKEVRSTPATEKKKPTPITKPVFVENNHFEAPETPKKPNKEDIVQKKPEATEEVYEEEEEVELSAFARMQLELEEEKAKNDTMH